MSLEISLLIPRMGEKDHLGLTVYEKALFLSDWLWPRTSGTAGLFSMSELSPKSLLIWHGWSLGYGYSFTLSFLCSWGGAFLEMKQREGAVVPGRRKTRGGSQPQAECMPHYCQPGDPRSLEIDETDPTWAGITQMPGRYSSFPPSLPEPIQRFEMCASGLYPLKSHLTSRTDSTALFSMTSSLISTHQKEQFPCVSCIVLGRVLQRAHHTCWPSPQSRETGHASTSLDSNKLLARRDNVTFTLVSSMDRVEGSDWICGSPSGRTVLAQRFSNNRPFKWSEPEPRAWKARQSELLAERKAWLSGVNELF